VAGPGDDLFVLDSANMTRKIGTSTIRRISTTTPQATTFVGAPARRAITDGIGADARFRSGTAIARDQSGVVYVADDAGTLRKIDPSTGQVTTLQLNGSDTSITLQQSAAISATSDGKILAPASDGSIHRFTVSGSAVADERLMPQSGGSPLPLPFIGGIASDAQYITVHLRHAPQ
jgi:hypothetical protein